MTIMTYNASWESGAASLQDIVRLVELGGPS